MSKKPNILSMLQNRSIPGGVTGNFIDNYPSHRILVLGSTQSLAEMSTRGIP